MWEKETRDRLEFHRKEVERCELEKQLIKVLATPISQEEWDFVIRNLENTIANEKYYISKIERQLACDHYWECLGGGGQVITDICRKCGASFDY